MAPLKHKNWPKYPPMVALAVVLFVLVVVLVDVVVVGFVVVVEVWFH